MVQKIRKTQGEDVQQNGSKMKIQYVAIPKTSMDGLWRLFAYRLRISCCRRLRAAKVHRTACLPLARLEMDADDGGGTEQVLDAGFYG